MTRLKITTSRKSDTAAATHLTRELYRAMLLRYYCFVHGWEFWAGSARNTSSRLPSDGAGRLSSHSATIRSLACSCI
jgi:hypothetical protein